MLFFSCKYIISKKNWKSKLVKITHTRLFKDLFSFKFKQICENNSVQVTMMVILCLKIFQIFKVIYWKSFWVSIINKSANYWKNRRVWKGQHVWKKERKWEGQEKKIMELNRNLDEKRKELEEKEKKISQLSYDLEEKTSSGHF